MQPILYIVESTWAEVLSVVSGNKKLEKRGLALSFLISHHSWPEQIEAFTSWSKFSLEKMLQCLQTYSEHSCSHWSIIYIVAEMTCACSWCLYEGSYISYSGAAQYLRQWGQSTFIRTIFDGVHQQLCLYLAGHTCEQTGFPHIVAYKLVYVTHFVQFQFCWVYEVL